ncbi:MAG: hypothetical protein AB9882_11940 [Ignavibacteriaceae bacterium]
MREENIEPRNLLLFIEWVTGGVSDDFCNEPAMVAGNTFDHIILPVMVERTNGNALIGSAFLSI